MDIVSSGIRSSPIYWRCSSPDVKKSKELDDNNPSKTEGKAALLILKECPTPKKIVEKGIDGIIAIWKEQKIRAVGRKRAVKFLETAKNSIGTSEGLVSAENDLMMLLEDYERKIQQHERTMALIESLAMQIPGFEKILEISGRDSRVAHHGGAPAHVETAQPAKTRAPDDIGVPRRLMARAYAACLA